MLRLHRGTEEGVATREDLPATALAAEPGGALWVEAVAPSPVEVEALQRRFGLHDLALEDAMAAGHPPKLEEFQDHVFLIAHTPADAGGDGLGTRKIGIFSGPDWVVTVLREPLADELSGLGAVRARLPRLLPVPMKLVHAIVDGMTDALEVHVEGVFDRIEALEERVYSTRPDGDVMPDIGELRHVVLGLLRVVRSQRDVAGQLMRGGRDLVPPAVMPYLRDVYDHLVRVYDLLEGAREAIGGVRDGYLSAVNNRLSDIMRVLTVIATVMMPLTLISGIYGMNVVPIPGSHGAAVFWLILAGMVVLAGGMLHYFRRKGWI